MTVSSLGNDKLKIALDAKELKRLFGSYEKIDCNNPNTKFALGLLLKQALPESDFKLSSAKLNVEIAKGISGGVDIYFLKSGLCLRAPKKEHYILEFSCLEHAVRAAKSASRIIPVRLDSRLYKTKTKYRIIISCEKEEYSRLSFMKEFTEKVYSSHTERAKTEEYGKEIIPNNALGILAGL